MKTTTGSSSLSFLAVKTNRMTRLMLWIFINIMWSVIFFDSDFKVGPPIMTPWGASIENNIGLRFSSPNDAWDCGIHFKAVHCTLKCWRRNKAYFFRKILETNRNWICLSRREERGDEYFRASHQSKYLSSWAPQMKNLLLQRKRTFPGWSKCMALKE